MCLVLRRLLFMCKKLDFLTIESRGIHISEGVDFNL